MKNYTKITSENVEEIKADIMQNFKNLLIGKTFKYKSLGISSTGIVTDVVNFTNFRTAQALHNVDSISPIVKTLIQNSDTYSEKSFVIYVSIQSKATIFDDSTVQALNELSDTLLELSRFEKDKLLEERLKEEEERKENDRKRIEDKEKEKRLLHEKNVMQSLMRTKTNAECSDTYYSNAIKWLAENVTSIYACIPDFADRWFESQFGHEAVRTVIDTNRKTSGGYSMKWSPSFSVTVKSTENMPCELYEYFDGKKKANNTQFVFDIVENYGFSFGKTQDIAKILSNT